MHTSSLDRSQTPRNLRSIGVPFSPFACVPTFGGDYSLEVGFVLGCDSCVVVVVYVCTSGSAIDVSGVST